jgi:hypothetical protein
MIQCRNRLKNLEEFLGQPIVGRHQCFVWPPKRMGCVDLHRYGRDGGDAGCHPRSGLRQQAKRDGGDAGCHPRSWLRQQAKQGELSIFDLNYTTFELHGPRNKQNVRESGHGQYITYAMAAKNSDIRAAVNKQPIGLIQTSQSASCHAK